MNRILIVEDDKEIVANLEILLKEEGYFSFVRKG